MKPKFDLPYLKHVLSREMYTQILDSFEGDDEHWVLEILWELDTIKPGDTFYLPEFHGKLQYHKSDDFDLELILKQGQELYQEKQQLRKRLDSVGKYKGAPGE